MTIKRTICAVLCMTTFTTAFAQWYNGDMDFRNGLQVGLFAEVYDDFDVTGSDLTVDSLYFNIQTGVTDFFTIESIHWQIRSGVSEGNGGVLVDELFSSNFTATPTGNALFGRDEYTFAITGLNTVLTPGKYWLGMSMRDFDTADYYMSTTSGANSVGFPAGNNGNSFYDGEIPYQPTTQIFGGTDNWDFSMGVNSAPVPEPATVIALGLGAVAILRRRKKA